MLIELELKIALTYTPIRNKCLAILYNSEHESLQHLVDGGKMTNEIQSFVRKMFALQFVDEMNTEWI